MSILLNNLKQDQQSAMMKTDAGTCASLSVSLLTTSSRLSNHFLLYTPIDLRFRLYQQSNQTSHWIGEKDWRNFGRYRCHWKSSKESNKISNITQKVTYKERLLQLNLHTLKYRRLRGDMIEVYKIIHDMYDRSVALELPRNVSSTRGNKI